MNKLTDEQLKELRELYRGECKWAADPEHVRTLLQEVEQLRLHQEVNQSWSLHMIESQILMGEEIERLKGKLKDAPNTLKWYADESSYEQEKTLYDENDPTDFYWEQPEIYEDKGARAKAAIQRIQEEGKNGGK